MAVTQSDVWKTCAKLYQETGKRPTVEAVRKTTRGSNSTLGPWVKSWCEAFYLEGSTIESLPASMVKSIAALWSQLQEMAVTDIEAVQEEHRQQCEALQVTIDSLSGQLDESQSKLADGEAKHAEIVTTLESGHAENERLQKTNTVLKERLNEAVTAANQSKEALDTLSSSHATLTAQYENLQQNNDYLQKDYEARGSALDRMSEKAHNLQQELSRVQEDQHTSRQENTALKETLQSAQFNLVVKSKDAERLEHQVETLTRSLADHHKVTARLETFQQRARDAEAQLTVVTARATKAETLRDKLQEDHKTSLDDLTAARDTITELTAKLFAMKATEKAQHKGPTDEI